MTKKVTRKIHKEVYEPKDEARMACVHKYWLETETLGLGVQGGGAFRAAGCINVFILSSILWKLSVDMCRSDVIAVLGCWGVGCWGGGVTG